MRSAFYELNSLKKVVFKGSRSEIPEKALNCCSGLTTIEFPEDLMSIEDEAFTGCTSLEKLTLPSGTRKIGYKAFYNCINLTVVELNDGLGEIGIQAFSYTNLKEISIPESVTVMRSAFYELKTLRKIVFKGSRSKIPEKALNCCFGLETIELPESLTQIESEALYACEGIQTLTIPSGVKSIGYNALSSCKNLQNLKVLSPDCVMDSMAKISESLTIYGYENSTAKKFAEENNYKFALLENAPVEASPSVVPTVEPSPVVTQEPSPVPTQEPSPAPTQEPSPVPTTEPSSVPSVEPTTIPLEDADMNGDEVISMSDYLVLIKRIITVTDIYEAKYDINKDSKIDAADVIILRRVFLGTAECV